MKPKPSEILALVRGALWLVDDLLLPELRRLSQEGKISIAEQAELQQRLESLRGRLNGEFSGPEWQVSDPTPNNAPD